MRESSFLSPCGIGVNRNVLSEEMQKFAAKARGMPEKVVMGEAVCVASQILETCSPFQCEFHILALPCWSLQSKAVFSGYS